MAIETLNTVTLTTEDIEKAEAYAKSNDKMKFVNVVAEKCFDRVEITAESMPVPPLFKENTLLKNRYLMGALLKLYLKIDFDPVEDDEWLMALDDYDKWAGSHVMNQIERMKSQTSVRDKCFDLLYDFKNLEKMLNVEVYAMNKTMNDLFVRGSLFVEMLIAPQTEEAYNEALAALKEELNKLPTKAEK